MEARNLPPRPGRRELFMFNRKKPTWREHKNVNEDWILPIHEDDHLVTEKNDIPSIEQHLLDLVRNSVPAGDRCTADAP